MSVRYLDVAVQRNRLMGVIPMPPPCSLARTLSPLVIFSRSLAIVMLLLFMDRLHVDVAMHAHILRKKQREDQSISGLKSPTHVLNYLE
jgi:hypothetical protein